MHNNKKKVSRDRSEREFHGRERESIVIRFLSFGHNDQSKFNYYTIFCQPTIHLPWFDGLEPYQLPFVWYLFFMSTARTRTAVVTNSLELGSWKSTGEKWAKQSWTLAKSNQICCNSCMVVHFCSCSKRFIASSIADGERCGHSPKLQHTSQARGGACIHTRPSAPPRRTNGTGSLQS